MKYQKIIILIFLMSIMLNANQDTYNGEYEWKSKNSEASLTVKKLDNGKYKIYGIALWGTTNKYGPNIGEIEFVANMKNNTIIYREGEYILSLKFNKNMIIVTETGGQNIEFGMNVFFDGKYKKVMKKKLGK